MSPRRALVWRRHSRWRISKLYNWQCAQFYDAAVKAHPAIPDEITKGEFGTLHGWLRTHLYQHGRKFGPSELVFQAAGEPMSVALYLSYLQRKYGEIYGLQAIGNIDQPEVKAQAYTVESH